MEKPPPGDPRVFFAAERTLLAWVRTGLTVMAFGFVVARFGLFLRLLARQLDQGVDAAELHNHIATAIGIVLVLVGVASFVFGAVQHRRFVTTLPAADVPRAQAANFPVALSLLLALFGIALAAYLVV